LFNIFITHCSCVVLSSKDWLLYFRVEANIPQKALLFKQRLWLNFYFMTEAWYWKYFFQSTPRTRVCAICIPR
jgi:hypothetical protein